MKQSNNKIEELRQKLNDMIVSKDYDKKELQSLSEELDVLIVKAMKDKQQKKILKSGDITVEELEEILVGLNLYKNSINL